MLLKQDYAACRAGYGPWRAKKGVTMKTAADIFNQIEEFLTLSGDLDLTRSEEYTLMSLEAAEWERWRTMSVPPNTPAPSLLVRRLDYANALLRRMAEADGAGSASAARPGSRM